MRQAELQRLRTATAAVLAGQEPSAPVYTDWRERAQQSLEITGGDTALAAAIATLDTGLQELNLAESDEARPLVDTPAAPAAEALLEGIDRTLTEDASAVFEKAATVTLWRQPWVWGSAAVLLGIVISVLLRRTWKRMAAIAPGEPPAANPRDEVSHVAEQTAAHLQYMDDSLAAMAAAGKQAIDTEYAPLLPRQLTADSEIADADPAQQIREGAEDVLGNIRHIMQVLSELQHNMHTQTNEVRLSDANQASMLESVQQAVRQGSGIDYRLHEVKRLLQSGDSAVIHTVEEMRSIERDIRGILDVIPIINTLAERTSLLSMNASIESAHAGEHGLGFAVVADEIGKLAEESSNNAESITGTLHSTVEQVQQALQSSENSAEVFDRLKGSIDEFSSTIGGISQSLSELSSGLHEIQRAVQEIVETTTIVERLTATMRVTGELLANNLGGGTAAADELKVVLQRYNSAIQDFQDGSRRLQDTVYDLDRAASTLSGELDRNRRLSG